MGNMPDQEWTDAKVLHVLMEGVARRVYALAFDSEILQALREAASDPNPNRLRDLLIVHLQSPLLGLFSYIDGGSGPTLWPGVALVSRATGNQMTEDLAWEYAGAQMTIDDEFDPGLEREIDSSNE